MGREALVTHEQVAAAADAMKAAGIKPSSRAVREKLGNVGSLGTINQMLQHWKNGQNPPASGVGILPPTLQRAILAFMEQELAAARAALENELAEQRQETADLATDNARQRDTIGDQALQLATMAAEQAKASGRAAQLETELDTARRNAEHERQGAEAARTELARAQLRLEAMPRLEADLAALRAALENQRQARTAAEQAAAVLTAQKTDLDSRVADARTQAESLAGQLSASREKVDTLTSALADARVAAQAAQARIALLKHETGAAGENAAQARAGARTASEQATERRSGPTTPRK